MFHPASLQLVPSGSEMITMKDENGFQQGYPVDGPTYMYVRSVITGQATIGNTMQQHTSSSMGSLPSATSAHSSQSSIASQVSQASSFSTTPGRYEGLL